MGVDPKPRRQHVGRTWGPWRRRRLERASDLAHLDPVSLFWGGRCQQIYPSQQWADLRSSRSSGLWPV